MSHISSTFLFRSIHLLLGVHVELATIRVGKGNIRTITEFGLELGLQQFHRQGVIGINVTVAMHHKAGTGDAANMKSNIKTTRGGGEGVSFGSRVEQTPK
jgi:hypothetical protein